MSRSSFCLHGEAGIRDRNVTGVQTCALPISGRVYVLPKQLDEKVARLHLQKLGVQLSTLTQKQADYIGVPVDGPYRSEERRVGKECRAVTPTRQPRT